MDIISWIKTTLSKYSSNSTHDKNAIYFVKNEDGKTGKIISDEVVYGNGGNANGVVVESPNQPTGGESVWVNPDEDMEEVEVYSRQQTDALINTKQNELTLTVKDNGNIVLGNIQGQSKEFMPATPSGDPMHYAYVAAGAEYNDTGADIVKTTPWADLADDDADKTVIHKAGYWYLNGLGDITNDEIRKIYRLSSDFPRSVNNDEVFYSLDIRTNFSNRRIGGNSSVTFYAGCYQSKLVVFNCNMYAISSVGGAFTNCSNLAHIGQLSFSKEANYSSTFYGANQLKTVKLSRIASNIQIPSPKLSIKSVLYMINNEAATAPITITLHADAYARAMANADILAALEAHPNVSLASA